MPVRDNVSGVAPSPCLQSTPALDSSCNVTAHGDAGEGKWRGNWRMEWVASTLHTTSEHGVLPPAIRADAQTSAASSRRPRRLKWTRPFRRKKKSGFCARVITFQLVSIFGVWPSHSRFAFVTVCDSVKPRFTYLGQSLVCDVKTRVFTFNMH